MTLSLRLGNLVQSMIEILVTIVGCYPTQGNTAFSLRLGILVQSIFKIVVTVLRCQLVHMYNFESTTRFLDSIHDIIQWFYDHIRSTPVFLQFWTVSFPTARLYNQTRFPIENP